MSRSLPWRATLAAGALVLAGCTAGASDGGETAPARASPTVEPAPSVDAPTDSPILEPPVVELVIGGVGHPGTVGGYTWDNYSQSAPWLSAPGLKSVDAPPAAELVVTLADDSAGIEAWAARVADAADTAAMTTTPLGSGGSPASFAGPGTGEWVLEVRMTYADGHGDAAWYWRLVVP